VIVSGWRSATVRGRHEHSFDLGRRITAIAEGGEGGGWRQRSPASAAGSPAVDVGDEEVAGLWDELLGGDRGGVAVAAVPLESSMSARRVRATAVSDATLVDRTLINTRQPYPPTRTPMATVWHGGTANSTTAKLSRSAQRWSIEYLDVHDVVVNHVKDEVSRPEQIIDELGFIGRILAADIPASSRLTRDLLG
jgi:hypothetical protein